jgi:hypothetical protein
MLALIGPSSPSALAIDPSGWKQDLKYLKTELPKRHENLFHTLPKPEFESDLATLEERLPTMSVVEVRFALPRLVAKVGDVHTGVEIIGDDLHRFPLGFYAFSDGIFVLSSTPAYAAAVGTRLMAIDDKPVEQVERALAQLSGCENRPCQQDHVLQMLPFAEYLRSQQLISDLASARFTFQAPGQEPFSLQISAQPSSAQAAESVVQKTAPGALEQQLWLKNQSLPYWFEYVPSSRLLYLAFNRCVDDKTRPFEALQRQVLATADAQPIDRLVVDLRRNGGGSEAVLRPLIKQIARRPALNRKGVLFVIVGKGTYSSAAFNALSFKEWTEATLVGEATGQKPNSYGEQRTLSLPNSGLRVNYSTRFWRRAKGDPESVMPDLPVEQTFTQFVAGIDAAMTKILKP